MPIEDRIRAGLARNGELSPPPVEKHLDAVRRQHRRRTGTRLLATAAIVALLALVPVAVLRQLGDRAPHPTPQPAATMPGTYQVVVAPGSSFPEAVGTWRVTLTDDGRVRATAPPGFHGTVSTGATYTIRRTRFTTNVFIESPGCQRTSPAIGTYRVRITSSGPDFTRLHDSCDLRAALFGGSWKELP
jgi:hypothetical protein